MKTGISPIGRFCGAMAAAALVVASLATPTTAMPLTGAGYGSFDQNIVSAQWQPKPGQGKPGVKPGPGGPGHAGNWGHHGGGGHWHNGVWVPLAIGFGVLGAAAAASAYGAPPQPGMCWYYDDPFHTTGHWDYC